MGSDGIGAQEVIRRFSSWEVLIQKKLLFAVLLLGCCLPLRLSAQNTVVEFARIKKIESLSGSVHDSSGAPMSSVRVQEFSPGWETALRVAETDENGNFSLPAVPGRKIYYLQFSADGFNPVRLRVQLDAKRGVSLRVELPVAT
jgi:Carboxypeptidase regulatory-like domain